MNIEQLTQAEHSAQFAIRHLQAALKTAPPVESLVLLQIIADAVKVENAIAALQFALGAKE